VETFFCFHVAQTGDEEEADDEEADDDATTGDEGQGKDGEEAADTAETKSK